MLLRITALVLLAVGCASQGCVDQDGNCPNYKFWCTNPQIQVVCPFTCGQCPGGPKWSDWTDWICDVTCGEGEERRTRTCQTGSDCQGEAIQVQSCQRPACAGAGGGCKNKKNGQPWCEGLNPNLCITNNLVKQTCAALCCVDPNQSCSDKTDQATWCPDYKKSCERQDVLRYCHRTCCKDGDGGTAKWSDWTNWQCDVTCGVGTETRSRTCETGNNCSGDKVQTRQCSLAPCVVPPKWSGWTNWQCDVTCGDGTETRSRTCETGNNCSGDKVQTRQCSLAPCTDNQGCSGRDKASWCPQYESYCKTNNYVQKNCPITCCEDGDGRTGVWGDWQWSSCSKACGPGTETGTRTCSIPNGCEGKAEDTRDCNLRDCDTSGGDCEDTLPQCPGYVGWCHLGNVKSICPATCGSCTKPTGEWGNWNWGTCSKACGPGTQTGTRTCSIPNGCTGKAEDTRSCKIKDCETAEWGEWQWSDCSKSCGPGTQTGTRTCSIPNGCTGKAEDTRSCKIKDCEEAGQWDRWGDWGDCSEECGPGTKTRKRRCLGPGECEGNAEATMNCNLGPCETIEWRPWKPWGKCSEECGPGKRTRSRECSVPGKCTGQNTQTEDCNEKECKLLDWKPWTPCSSNCKGGTQTRTRECNVKGKCGSMGPTFEEQDCNSDIDCGADGWGPCSKTCGDGTKKKMKEVLIDGKNVMKSTYAACKIRNCPKTLCPRDATLRYGGDHTCCKNNINDQCGRSINNQRIIGGIPAKAAAWPWMCAVYMDSNEEFCGASIISDKWVISAAHCFQDEKGRPRLSSKWRVLVGVLEFTENGEWPTGSSQESIKRAVVHPDYDFPSNDIAVVELQLTVDFHATVRPVCMPFTEEPPRDERCFVTGWGVKDINTLATSATLLELGIEIFDRDLCIDRYRDNNDMKRFVPWLEKDTSNYYCAGSMVRTVDSCQGDSGGPLVCQRCSSCTWYLAGIVSFGPRPCGTFQMPAIYTKVKSYEQWIEDVTGVGANVDPAPKCEGRA